MPSQPLRTPRYRPPEGPPVPPAPSAPPMGAGRRAQAALAGQQGIALPTVLLVMALILAMVAGVAAGLSRASKGSGLELEAEQAYYAAYSGIQRMAAWSQAWTPEDEDPAGHFGWHDEPDYQDLQGEEQELRSYQSGGATVVVAHYTMDWTAPVGDPPELRVEATGRKGRATHTLVAFLTWDPDAQRVRIRYD